MTAALKNMTSGAKGRAREITVGAGYVRGLLDFAVSKGADRAALLTRAGLNDADVADIDNRIPLAKYEALGVAGAELAREPALALLYGEAVRMQDISIVGLICEACATTSEVGEQLNRYGRLVFDLGDGTSPDILRFVRSQDGVWLEAASPVFTAHRFVVEAELARLVWNTRKMFAGDAAFQGMQFPLEVHFVHEAPDYRAAYERVFQAPVTFAGRWNALRVDPKFFALKQPPTNRYVFGVLSERIEKLLTSLQSATTLRGRIESLLIPILHTGEINVERVAAELGMSRQTLYRKLKGEGASFETLLDELRHKMALHYLDGKKVSVNETAYLVGFSDPSAFSRAFRRWTGTSPRGRAKPAQVKE